MKRILDEDFDYSSLNCRFRQSGGYSFLIFPEIDSYIILNETPSVCTEEYIKPHSLYQVGVITESQYKALVKKEASEWSRRKEESDLYAFRSALSKYPAKTSDIIKEHFGDYNEND